MLPARPMNTPKSVIDLIWPETLSPRLKFSANSFHGLLLALLEAERDATTLFVHVEHHDFDFLAGLHDLGRVDVLVGPVHFGDVDQAFDAVLDLHERAVVGDVRDLAEHAGVRRDSGGRCSPTDPRRAASGRARRVNARGRT